VSEQYPAEGGTVSFLLPSEKPGVFSEMNVVPLIDVLLVLLIIFMVITPLVPRGLEAVIPQVGESRAVPSHVVVVRLEADGSLRVNQEPHIWQTLEERREGIFRSWAEKVGFIGGAAEVEFRQVARAIAVMRSAAIEQVGLLTSAPAAAQP
jgi:biopolymer transport protein ExbD